LIDSDSAVEIDIGCDDLYLSVDTDTRQVEAKFDQNGKLIIQLREKYRCSGFEGVAKVIVRASTGITRDGDNFNDVIKQNRYDIEKFTVTFKDYNDGKDCNCVRNLDLEKATHLAF